MPRMSEKSTENQTRKEIKMGRPKTPSHLETRRVVMTLNYKTRLFLEIIKAHGTWASDSEIVQNLVINYVETHKDLFDRELIEFYEKEFQPKAKLYAKEQMQKILKELQEFPVNESRDDKSQGI